MRVIALSALSDFWLKHPDALEPLSAWYTIVSRIRWVSPFEVRAACRNISFSATKRVVFNIKGNDYRPVLAMHYNRQIA